jgi:hypothetical protein
VEYDLKHLLKILSFSGWKCLIEKGSNSGMSCNRIGIDNSSGSDTIFPESMEANMSLKSNLGLTVVIILFLSAACFGPKPEITDVYWATDEEGTRYTSSGAERDDVLYAYVTTNEDANGVQVRLTIQEYDLIGEDEDCLDNYITVNSQHASMRWTVGWGDGSFLEGDRDYYITAQLVEGNTDAVFSDHIYVDW